MIDEEVPISHPEVVREEEFVDLLARLDLHQANLHLIEFTDDRDEASDIFTASIRTTGVGRGSEARAIRMQYTSFLTVCFRPFKEDDPTDVKDHILRQRRLMFHYLDTAFDFDNPDQIQARLGQIEKAAKGAPFSSQEVNEARLTIMERFADFGRGTDKA